MTATDRLCVLIAGKVAGEAAQSDNGKLTFTYEDGYSGIPLSLSMPVSNRVFPTRRFARTSSACCLTIRLSDRTSPGSLRRAPPTRSPCSHTSASTAQGPSNSAVRKTSRRS